MLMSLNGRKILIVEDDFSSRLYLNTLLGKSGASLLNASEGQEAFDLVLKNPDIELVLMDIQMPGVDGYTCTRMIREAGRDLIIIAQTAYGLAGDRERMLTSGFDDYLIKPISGASLIQKIEMYLK